MRPPNKVCKDDNSGALTLVYAGFFEFEITVRSRNTEIFTISHILWFLSIQKSRVVE